MTSAAIKNFLIYGDPKRLRTAELSSWTGKAVAGPRSEIDIILARDESGNTCVKLLNGKDPDTTRSPFASTQPNTFWFLYPLPIFR